MTGRTGRDPFSEDVRREAADWFAQLRGRDGDGLSADFQAWRKQDPANAEAYERLLQQWDRTAFLASTGLARDRDLSRVARQPFKHYLAAAAACLALVSVGAVALYAVQSPGQLSARMLQLRVVTADQPRVVDFDDDTRVTLAARSTLELSFTPQSRRALLSRGRARFEMPRTDPRPLVVEAGSGRVVAAAGTFEVAIEAGGTRVAAIAGPVDAGPSKAPAARRLAPGEQVVIPAGATGPSPTVTTASRDTTAMVAFDAAPLAEAIGRFNHASARAIAFDDATLTSRRISGAFRTDDPLGFARAIVAMFGGSVREDMSGAILIVSAGGARK